MSAYCFMISNQLQCYLSLQQRDQIENKLMFNSEDCAISYEHIFLRLEWFLLV